MRGIDGIRSSSRIARCGVGDQAPGRRPRAVATNRSEPRVGGELGPRSVVAAHLSERATSREARCELSAGSNVPSMRAPHGRLPRGEDASNHNRP
jgi:hypothetical protein